MNVHVRAMTPDDAEAIVNVLNPLIESGKYTVLDTLLTVDFEREFLTQFPHQGIFHVAECRETHIVRGFQCLEPFASYTHACDHVGVIGTYVDISYRGQGIGRQLSQATFAAAHKKGYEKLFAYVRGDNPDALLFYLKQGFRIIGTAQKHAKFDTQYIDEILIEKFL